MSNAWGACMVKEKYRSFPEMGAGNLQLGNVASRGAAFAFDTRIVIPIGDLDAGFVDSSSSAGFSA